MGMLTYIGKRSLFAVFALFIALTFVFVIYRAIAGDPVSLYAPTGRQGISEEQRQVIIKNFGLDKSVLEQYILYLQNLFRGDLGHSLKYRRPVSEVIAERLPWTMFLIGTSTVISTSLGVLIGAYSGWRRATKLDTAFVTSSLVINAIPVFFVGMVFIALFGFQAHPSRDDWKIPIPAFSFLFILIILYGLNKRRKGKSIQDMFIAERKAMMMYGFLIGVTLILTIILVLFTDGYIHFWFPISGGKSPGIEQSGSLIAFTQDILFHAFLPLVTLIIFGILGYGWFMRGNVIGVLTEDYVQTAISKGLSDNQVLYGHCMRNSILPVITDIGLNFGSIVGGSILIETLFGYPGTGLLIYDALLSRDYTLVQGSFIIITALTLFGLFIAEIIYGIIDPRVKTY
ncbi:MAG: ABC transporter permease [Candidatus Hodarchaeales archaeon]|jgi:peptide/nickel transport system permease protein